MTKTEKALEACEKVLNGIEDNAITVTSALLLCLKIARLLNDTDAIIWLQYEYVLGLLHDIGRKFGVRHLGHVSDGYRFMMSLGYDEAAKICLTHSFNNHTVDEYIGKLDVSEEEMKMIKAELARTVYDDYDRLIQLCDSLAGAEGVLDIEDRMNDVKKRYGFYPQDKWDSNMRLKRYFEKKMKKDIYLVCEKTHLCRKR